SLTIGGWDPIGGARFANGAQPPFEAVLAGARARVPDLALWITPELEPPIAACWNALAENDGAEEALTALRCPILLWSGEDDTCWAAAKALAERRGLAFLSIPGDHAAAIMMSGAPRAIRHFIDAAAAS